ncbi:tetratricopeptide repeat protein 1 [Teleopsis dalmanni]|uniref:tetratricopeptide repeat protein 1 n=1 Tax=Teleopsis dalmanni TaxID=139649 RepID=UPI0018CF6765|nr:tetratricopeptide repeat protein 1 [Teleopsis dalmanni]
MDKPRVIQLDKSDDEYEDALNYAANSQDDTAEIDELTKQQSELHLSSVAEGDDKEFSDGNGSVAEAGDDDMNEGFEDMLRENENNMTAEELQQNKEKADQLKLEGNEFFKNGDAERAVEVYSEAIKLCPTTYTKERAVLYGNRAAAKIKLDAKKSAIDDCTASIKLWPEYVRAILRRGKLYELEDKLDEALEDYKKVNELDRSQREAIEGMMRLPPLIQERNERMKEEMLSKLKDLGNMVLKPFGLSTNNFKMQQDPNTGSYSVNFVQKPN